MNKRFFAFGCSFTQYYWPTWADLISKEIPETYLYAKCGAGNFYIFQAVIEAVVKHNIGKDDLVMIMFSNVTREDRYTNKDGWITPGNLFFQDEYSKEFMDKFFCEKGYLMRDLSLIEGIIRSLTVTNADYKLMSIVPLDSLSSDDKKMTGVEEVLKFYNLTLEQIHPSVFDVVFAGTWNSRSSRPAYTTHWSDGVYVDNHPTPDEHLEYIMSVFPTTEFKEETKEFARQSTKELLNYKTYTEIINNFNTVIPASRL